tara:strand:+ start:251 stop:1060 length:810 start_codon:yes stop_codon:yes gene_type:complete
MRYLILGSSGQVGNALKNFYGNSAVGCDMVESENEDLRYHTTQIEKKISQADFIHFMAFDVGGSRYLQKYQNTFEFIDNNMRIMQNTFSLIKKHNKPFIFASSQMSNMDYSSYGTLKRVGEWYTKILGGITVKFWNVYGIEHDLEKSHVITDFIIKAKDSGVIDMMTDGTEERQFLYSEDCCEALDVLKTNYDTIDRNRELHITNHKWSTILDVANEVVKHFPAKVIPNSKKDMVQQNKRNEPDPYILEYWQPKTSLADGIKKICEHYV